MSGSTSAISSHYDDISGEASALERYMHEITGAPRLSAQEERELAPLIRAGDQDALSRLVQANLRFVVVIAMEYRNRGLPILDLVSEGNIGLIMAARRFDETRGCKFISYAVWWIRQAIRQAFADDVRFIRLPRLQAETLNRLEEAIREREQTTGQSTSIEDAATHEEKAGRPLPRHVNHLLNASARPYSLDEPVADGEGSWISQVADMRQSAPDDEVIEEMMKETVSQAVNTLPEREAEILRQYFGIFDDNPKTLEEIGQQLGMSRERVRQLKERALQRLRHAPLSRRLHACL